MSACAYRMYQQLLAMLVEDTPLASVSGLGDLRKTASNKENNDESTRRKSLSSYSVCVTLLHRRRQNPPHRNSAGANTRVCMELFRLLSTVLMIAISGTIHIIGWRFPSFVLWGFLPGYTLRPLKFFTCMFQRLIYCRILLLKTTS